MPLVIFTTTSCRLRRQVAVAFGFLSLFLSAICFAQEGVAHNGIVAADVAGDDIAENDITTDAAAEQFYVEDIKETMRAYIISQLDSEGNFHLLDDKADEILDLKFIRVHDPVRQIKGDIYFACTDFHVVGKPDKIYDLDFWMNGKTGELIIYDNKVHKEPRWSLFYGWYKHPRYTFVNDEIEYLY
jgi:hypothetical protein